MNSLSTIALRDAFAELLTRRNKATLAFTRDLPPALVRSLASDTSDFAIEGWQIRAVVGTIDPDRRFITADHAVAEREDLGAHTGNLLLLVDTEVAGPGMDGIYSAGREFKQRQLVERASIAVRRSSANPELWAAVDVALAMSRRRAPRLRPRGTWQDFSFECAVATNPDRMGELLADIGLWPVVHAPGSLPTPKDLDDAEQMARRIIDFQGARRGPEALVAALRFAEEQGHLARDLVAFIRSHAGMPSVSAFLALKSEPALWLGSIRPRIFSEVPLVDGIRLSPWIRARNATYAWSGLRLADGVLELVLPLEDVRGRSAAKLGVRWTTDPADLPAGTVRYRVEVRANDDVLASREVTHGSKAYQGVSFTRADFDDLDDAEVIGAHVVVSVIGASANDLPDSLDGPSGPGIHVESPLFVLRFGDVDASDGEPSQAAGRVHPTMALAAVSLDDVDREMFASLAESGMIAEQPVFGTDKRGFVTLRHNHRGARVAAPRAYIELAKAWAVSKAGVPGRWRVTVRADGSPLTGLANAEFIPINCNDRAFERASRIFAEWVNRPGGPVGALYHHDNTPAVKNYVEAAAGAFRNSTPDITLVQTVEVVSLSGRTIGIIVLPTHPLRVAWQQSFDMLVWHAHFETGVDRKHLDDLVTACSGSQYPAMLPGIGETATFIFGDTLGFHAVALVPAGDPEPKASIAILRQVLTGNESHRAADSGTGVAGIGGQIRKYLGLHPAYTQVRTHALRAGDGMTVARALGGAIERSAEDVPDDDLPVTFDLDLYPAARDRADLTGRHLALTASRDRKSAGSVAEADRWLLESVRRPGGQDVPRLTWARRETPEPDRHAHLAIMFDAFSTHIEHRPSDTLPAGRLELHGLMASPVRVFTNDGEPTWIGHIPPKPAGTPHPVSDGLTRRLLTMHALILDAVTRRFGWPGGSVPVFATRISDTEQSTLDTVHRLSDWVITVDRNAGIEYFDSPNDDQLKGRQDTYVIDSVPERSDLGAVQLMTSTTRTDELQRLLTHALGTMNITQSPRNADALVRSLKSISGRLTMRLSRGGTVAQELVALAAVQRHCETDSSSPWLGLSLRTGFLVPLDDVSDLFGPATAPENGQRLATDETNMRTDFLHVTAGRTGTLALTFVEVKFRRTLRAARAAQTLSEIEGQLRGSHQRWIKLFGDSVSALQRTINRMRLARILTFYMEKGQRHSLGKTGAGEVAAKYMRREIEKLAFLEGALPDAMSIGQVGVVFCPEYVPADPARLDSLPDHDVWLFGPATLPDSPGAPAARVENTDVNDPGPASDGDDGIVTGTNGVSSPALPEAPRSRGEHTVIDAKDHSSNGGDGTSPEIGERIARTLTSTTTHREGDSTPEIVVNPSMGASTEATTPTATTNSGSTARLPTAAVPSPEAIATTNEPSIPTPPSQAPDGVVLGYRDDGETPAIWRQDIKTNPHLMILGLPGMGKTSALLNICEQLIAQDITPIIFSYHEDIDEKLEAISTLPVTYVGYDGLGFNPMRPSSSGPFAHVDSVGNLRDIFSAIFPDLGEIQLGKLRDAILASYTDRGWSKGVRGETPPFRSFYDTLISDPKPDRGLNVRLKELADYGFFDSIDGGSSLLELHDPVVIQIHKSPNDALQRAFATFILYSLYQAMFQRGLKDRITHAIIFDEAHRASKLKLIPTMAKECRKYGISFLLASQEAKDFSDSVFTAIANYLALRVNEDDARLLARQFADSAQVRAYADRIKAMPKYHAYYFGEQAGRPMRAKLIQGMSEIETRRR